MFIQLQKKELINVNHIVNMYVSIDEREGNRVVPAICCKDIFNNCIVLYEGNTIEQCQEKLYDITQQIRDDSNIIEITNNDYEEHFIDIIAYGDSNRFTRFKYSPQEPQLLIDLFEISTYHCRSECLYVISHKMSHKKYTDSSPYMYKIKGKFEIFKNKIRENSSIIDFEDL